MEVDTGASLSIISKATYAYLQSQERSSPLQGTECSAPYIHWEGKEGPLLVVIEKDPALLGRNCLGGLHLNWHMIKQSSSVNQRLEKVVQNYSHLFKEGRGTLPGVKAKIHVDSSDTSVFYKARPVPYTLRDKIEHAISKYQKRQEQSNLFYFRNGLPHCSGNETRWDGESLWRLQTNCFTRSQNWMLIQFQS